MIEKCDTPDVYKELDYLYCVKAFDNNGVYAYLGLDMRVPESAVLHLEVIRFSHHILKKLVGDWQGVVRILKQNNIKRIVVAKSGIIDDNRKFLKFIRWFGFHSVEQQFVSIQEI